MLTVVMLRYLQSSIHDAYLMQDPEGPGKGFCLPGCGCYKTVDSTEDIDRKETIIEL